MRAAATLVVLLSALAAQRPAITSVRSAAGAVVLEQAVRDAGADALVLLVASHPDDRYLLPAIWLRRAFGLRVAVLLATRGGGGQNSLGAETGDALERIRTLETEDGCALVGADAWYLDRPDAGFRRSAEEAFAEWGRDTTLRDLAQLLRRIRPDAVMTTHHKEEQHGHDLALVELLPEAIQLAGASSFGSSSPPHAVAVLFTGAGSSPSANALRIDVDRLDLAMGITHRRRAWEVLRSSHLSPGSPAPIEDVFDRELVLEPQAPVSARRSSGVPFTVRSLFDVDMWPGAPERAKDLEQFLGRDLPARVASGQRIAAAVARVVEELRGLRPAAAQAADVLARLERRIAALEQVLLASTGLQFEVDLSPGTIAVGGEEMVVAVQLHRSTDEAPSWRVEGLDGCAVERQTDGQAASDVGDADRASLVIRVPVPANGRVGDDPMAARFRGERFTPPVRLRFHVRIEGVEVPVTMALPIEQRSPVELHVVPRMLLLPTVRTNLQFSVGVARNSLFPVEGDLEVRGPAGYAIGRDRIAVALRDQRSEMFGFEVAAPADRKPGVDVLRIRLGANHVELPVHKIDVRVPAGLRIGLLRSRDDTLPSVLGAGGLGLPWSELSDADLAVADLRAFETIAVDIRALRDRPAARNAFRRLLEFAQDRGRRLVVFYQKDVEFHPEGESFVGAPYPPFHIGKARVTRADAPVAVLLPDHALLRHPNAIRPADWDGWEQERALYLPRVWAPQYQELLELADPQQPAERGALLYARTGQGEYVYCALALWRQLKKLHPGAVRLLVNLLTPSARN
ncbi:MAG: PIG-L family deacetylase [Planctomycetota bacterium]